MKREDKDIAFLRSNAATMSVASIVGHTFSDQVYMIRDKIEELLDVMRKKQASGDPEYYVSSRLGADVLEGLLRYHLKGAVHRTSKVSENEVLIVMPVSGSISFGGVALLSLYNLMDDPYQVPFSEERKRTWWQRMFGRWND